MDAVRKIDKAISIFTKILAGVAGVMMGALTIVVFVEVVMRYVFRSPNIITTELTTILFPWIVCLSAITIARNEENTALVALKDKFKGVPRHIVEIFINVVIIIFAIMMSVASFTLCATLATQTLPITGISKVFSYGSMFIGFVGVAIVVTFNLIRYILVKILKKVELTDDVDALEKAGHVS